MSRIRNVGIARGIAAPSSTLFQLTPSRRTVPYLSLRRIATNEMIMPKDARESTVKAGSSISIISRLAVIDDLSSFDLVSTLAIAISPKMPVRIQRLWI